MTLLKVLFADMNYGPSEHIIEFLTVSEIVLLIKKIGKFNMKFSKIIESIAIRSIPFRNPNERLSKIYDCKIILEYIKYSVNHPEISLKNLNRHFIKFGKIDIRNQKKYYDLIVNKKNHMKFVAKTSVCYYLIFLEKITRDNPYEFGKYFDIFKKKSNLSDSKTISFIISYLIHIVSLIRDYIDYYSNKYDDTKKLKLFYVEAIEFMGKYTKSTVMSTSRYVLKVVDSPEKLMKSTKLVTK